MNTFARAALRIEPSAVAAPVEPAGTLGGIITVPERDQNVPGKAVFRRDGVPISTSKAVATLFGKRHDNVMRDIRNLIAADPGLALSFEEQLETYKGPNGSKRTRRSYIINARGAALLVMGFTGPEALHWKQKFLDAFDHLLERENENHKAFLRSMKAPGLTREQAAKRSLKARQKLNAS